MLPHLGRCMTPTKPANEQIDGGFYGERMRALFRGNTASAGDDDDDDGVRLEVGRERADVRTATHGAVLEIPAEQETQINRRSCFTVRLHMHCYYTH
jgi:hypothetical protein